MLYNPQKTDGKPYTCKEHVRKKGSYDIGVTTTTKNTTGKRHPLSVLQFPHCKSKMHPTQKPVALLEWLVKTYTNPGDTVLDPVMGSATTGIACLRTGRHFVGIEKDATYFDVARKRVDDERASMGLPTADLR